MCGVEGGGGVAGGGRDREGDSIVIMRYDQPDCLTCAF